MQRWHQNGVIYSLRKRLSSLLTTTNFTEMKRVLQIASLSFMIILAGSWRNKAAAQVSVDISYQTFYDELSPYGEWIDYPEYGYVWVPSESEGFMPYETNGHWVWSDEYDWMWVSDYSWGWAPFHYGRWFNDPYYGWMWVPGYEWSPAWVCWRDGGDYYGWAPLRPGFNISIGFSSYNPPINYWSFAPRSYITSPRIWDYCVDRGRNVTIINNTTIINNYNRRSNIFVSGGPRRLEAERYAGRINPVRFREASRPGRAQFRGSEVSVYRPRVQQENGRRFTPRNFEQYDRNRGQNNNGFARRGNDNVQRNGNNLPNRDNNRFERRNDNNQPGSNNDNRRNIFDRSNDQQRNNESRNMDRRGSFDRNNNQPSNNDRQNRRNFERPVQPQSNPSQPNQNDQRRDFFQRRNNDQPAQNRGEMRNDNRFNRPQQMERQQPQPQPRQFENRQFERRQSAPQAERQQQPQQRQFENRQFERRQNSPQPERQQQAQPRQFENRGGGNNHEQRGGNDNNGRGHGRRF